MTAPLHLFVDGSNILMKLRPNGRPSYAVFLAMFNELKERGYKVCAIFDQSIRYLLEKEGASSEWALLEREAATSKGEITFEVEADPHILAAAIATNGAVVNHSDRYRKWVARFGLLPPIVRVGLIGELLTFNFEDESVPPFAVKFSSLAKPNPPQQGADIPTQQEINMTERLLRSNRRQDQGILKARLIIFALDSSGSMFNRQDGGYRTWDSRSKADHLIAELRSAVERMCNCKVSHSLYCGLVAFAGSADVIETRGHKLAHVTHLRELLSSPTFDYSSVVTDGNGSNIGNALVTSRRLINAVLAEPDNLAIASSWSATIILFTDGLATNKAEVMDAAAHLEGGFSGPLQKVDLACVGIGSDVDFPLLKSIASCPSEIAIKMLRNSRLLDKLPRNNAGSPLMAISIDMMDKYYSEVIRSFIDIASS